MADPLRKIVVNLSSISNVEDVKQVLRNIVQHLNINSELTEQRLTVVEDDPTILRNTGENGVLTITGGDVDFQPGSSVVDEEYDWRFVYESVDGSDDFGAVTGNVTESDDWGTV